MRLQRNCFLGTVSWRWLVWIQLITIITRSYSPSPSPPLGWFECNCTYQEPSGIAIWEPCNYASNLAYDRFPNLHFQNNNICLWARLMVEVCLQQGWAFPQETVEDSPSSSSSSTSSSQGCQDCRGLCHRHRRLLLFPWKSDPAWRRHGQEEQRPLRLHRLSGTILMFQIWEITFAHFSLLGGRLKHPVRPCDPRSFLCAKEYVRGGSCWCLLGHVSV